MRAKKLFEKLEKESQETFSGRGDETPFDAIGAAIQNAMETHPNSFRSDEWYECALGSLKSNCCDSVPENVCDWFKQHGLRY